MCCKTWCSAESSSKCVAVAAVDAAEAPGAVAEAHLMDRARLVRLGTSRPAQSQATAVSRAAQIWRIRRSLSQPNLVTSHAWLTKWTESRLTADGIVTGSSPGSSTTSLANPRMVLVHGATIAVVKRSKAESRERTTTGRWPMSGDSHHHTSPQRGREAVTTPPTLRGSGRARASVRCSSRPMTPGRPTRRACP